MIAAAGFVQTKGVGSSFQCAMEASRCSRTLGPHGVIFPALLRLISEPGNAPFDE